MPQDPPQKASRHKCHAPGPPRLQESESQTNHSPPPLIPGTVSQQWEAAEGDTSVHVSNAPSGSPTAANCWSLDHTFQKPWRNGSEGNYRSSKGQPQGTLQLAQGNIHPAAAGHVNTRALTWDTHRPTTAAPEGLSPGVDT